MRAGGISIHCVDVATGQPARGMKVSLHRLSGGEILLAEGAIGANGQLDHPTVHGEGIIAGTYEVRFHIGDYLKAHGQFAGFLDVVPFRFLIEDIGPHLHLPMKFTPYGYAVFKGV